MKGPKFEPGDEVRIAGVIGSSYIILDWCVLRTGAWTAYKYRVRANKAGWTKNRKVLEQDLTHANALVRLAREM